MNYHQEKWKTLNRRERAINAELRQPGISREWRNTLEAEKKKVQIHKQKLLNTRHDSSCELDQSQTRTLGQGQDQFRELETNKWAERQIK